MKAAWDKYLRLTWTKSDQKPWPESRPWTIGHDLDLWPWDMMCGGCSCSATAKYPTQLPTQIQLSLSLDLTPLMINIDKNITKTKTNRNSSPNPAKNQKMKPIVSNTVYALLKKYSKQLHVSITQYISVEQTMDNANTKHCEKAINLWCEFLFRCFLFRSWSVAIIKQWEWHQGAAAGIAP